MPVSRAKAEAEFSARLLKLDCCRVLDLACGYGRHARHLASNNQIFAADLNRSYLQQATQGLRDRTAANLLPIQADMRQIPFCDSTMDAVLFLFNSFGYFAGATAAQPAASPRQQVWKLPEVFYERQLVPSTFGKYEPSVVTAPANPAVSNDENGNVLGEIARVLKPGAQLLLELPNSKPLLRAVAEHPRRHIAAAGYQIEEQYEWDSAARVLHNRTRFRIRDHIEEGEYDLRLYSSKEIRGLLAGNGLSVVQVYGDYQGGKYFPANSPVLLVHARKPMR
ncbi:MAG: class I SAM-dependent methyltransferase [Candidatus Sumerlaeaceae bacterium]